MSVRFAILGLLQQESRHGYELLSAFSALVGGSENWPVKPAQIYTTLSRLHEQRFIRQEGTGKSGGPEKRIWGIEESGRVALRRWLSETVPSEHLQDPFALKLGLLLALKCGDPLRLIYAQRALLLRELHALHARRSERQSSAELAQVLHFDQVLMHTEADLRWLDMVEARLDELKKQPAPRAIPKPRGRPPRPVP